MKTTHLMMLTILLTGSGASCTKLTKRQTDDQRTRVPPGESPPVATPTPTPATDLVPSPIPEVPSVAMSKPQGNFSLSEVHCTVATTEPVVSGLRFNGALDLNHFELPIGNGCIVKQTVRLEMTDKTMNATFGAAACEGVCPDACPATVLATAGTAQSLPYTPVTDGFSIETPGLILPGHCNGASPQSLSFARATAPLCAKRWNGADEWIADQLAVLDGQLKWSSDRLAVGATHALWLEGLTGDFSITVPVAAFESGGSGTFFRIKLVDAAVPTTQAFAEFSTFSTLDTGNSLLSVSVITEGQFDEALHSSVTRRTTKSGALVISKVGTSVTATAIAGTNTVSRQSDPAKPFTDGRYTLFLEIGNRPDQALALAPTAVSLDHVAIQDGAGAKHRMTDDFGCDSLQVGAGTAVSN